ncbi:MAG: hypothetical protein JWN70_839 [Planctomycetaceae bacterium]|nr:hypothetical protein [Planctomycetaceae bacterium]
MSKSPNSTVRNPRQWFTVNGMSLAVSIILFLVSLTQDGYYIDRPEDPRAWAPCIGLLLIGWLGVLEGVWAWLANPALAVAWLLMLTKPGRISQIILAVLATGLALSFLLYPEILANEAGGRTRITGYGAGYWLWISSMVTAAVGATGAMIFQSPRSASPTTPAEAPPTSGDAT